MFTLLNLPYQQEALDPVISAQTLSFHHGKHLQAYVDNLNKLLPGSEYEGMSLEDIVKNAPAGAIFNNAGQILNHELYFKQFRAVSDAAHEPTGALAAQIIKQWGSIDAFKTDFESKGVSLFGSGWVWLSAEADGTLVITQEPGASSHRPLADHRLASHPTPLPLPLTPPLSQYPFGLRPSRDKSQRS